MTQPTELPSASAGGGYRMYPLDGVVRFVWVDKKNIRHCSGTLNTFRVAVKSPNCRIVFRYN